MLKYFHLPVAAGILFLAGCQVVHSQCPPPDPSRGIYESGVYDDGVIVFRHTDDSNYPLNAVLYRRGEECRGNVVAKYSFEGSPPTVEYVFEHTYRGHPVLFVIVSWEVNHRGLGVYGKLYQVYAYRKDGKGGLVVDQDIVSRNDMTGLEGTDQNMPSHFSGKTPAGVIRILDATSGR